MAITTKNDTPTTTTTKSRPFDSKKLTYFSENSKPISKYHTMNGELLGIAWCFLCSSLSLSLSLSFSSFFLLVCFHLGSNWTCNEQASAKQSNTSFVLYFFIYSFSFCFDLWKHSLTPVRFETEKSNKKKNGKRTRRDDSKRYTKPKQSLSGSFVRSFKFSHSPWFGRFWMQSSPYTIYLCTA